MAPIESNTDFTAVVPSSAQLLLLPALQAPPGADTYFTLHSSVQVYDRVTIALCIALPGILILLRAYTKLVVVKKVDIADYLILLGFIFVVTIGIVMRNLLKNGLGVHQWQITIGQFFGQLYWMNIEEITYIPANFVIKVSILVQYLKIFAPSRDLNRTMFYGAWIVIIINVIVHLFLLFWATFYCSPRSRIWNKLQPGTCRTQAPGIVFSACFNIVTDVVILLLPTTSLWKLKIPLKKKIQITLLFGTGILACGMSVVRIIYTLRITKHNTDVSRNLLWLCIWSFWELSLVLMVSSALTLPKLIKAKGPVIGASLSFVRTPFFTVRSLTQAQQNKASIQGQDSRSPEQKEAWKQDGSHDCILKSVHFETWIEPAYDEDNTTVINNC